MTPAGDYNTTPERHLGAASIERLSPDLLISEATYASTARDDRPERERKLLAAVRSWLNRQLCQGSFWLAQMRKRGYATA